MAKEDVTFCTAINCIDGRVQRPVLDYMKGECDTAYVDMITAPGPDGIVAKEGDMYKHLQSGVAISVEKHASNVVAIVGHDDCAGNPVSK